MDREKIGFREFPSCGFHLHDGPTCYISATAMSCHAVSCLFKWRFLEIRGTILGNKNYSIFGSILGSPFWETPK